MEKEDREEKIVNCGEVNCRCAVAWIEINPKGGKVLVLRSKHHGNKHETRLSESELFQMLKEAN